MFATAYVTLLLQRSKLSITVENDADSDLRIEEQGVSSDIVEKEGNTIQFEGDVDLNADSDATVGEFDDVDFDNPGELVEQAFVVANDHSDEVDLDIGFEVTDNTSEGAVKLVVTDQALADAGQQIEGGEEHTFQDIDTSSDIVGGLVLTTDDTGGDENLDATITIDAIQSDQTEA